MSQRAPRPRVYDHWPLTVALFLYLGATGWLVAASLRLTHGHFSYAIDDGYIHMSIARNLVSEGTWGVSPGEFAGAASSLAWPLLLAALFVAGPWHLAPLVLNLAFGVLALATAYRFLRRSSLPPSWIAVALVVGVFVTPLTTLTLDGMEHTLQTWVTLAFLLWGAEAAASPATSPQVLRRLALGAAVATATRYEGSFAVALIAALLLGRRRPKDAAWVAAAGAAPIVLYGLVSWGLGGLFLPNSVIIKAPAGWVSPTHDPLHFFLRDPFNVLVANPHVLVLFVAALFLLIARAANDASPADVRSNLLVCYVALVYLQFTFARSGWGFRYEAYLVFIGVVLVAAALAGLPWPRSLPSWTHRAPLTGAVVVASFFVLTPMVLRATEAWEWTPWAQKNMYDQTHQVGHFLNAYYRDQPVALVDVGAPTYFGHVRAVDLAGLGSNEVARLSPHHWLTPEQIQAIATEHGVRIAILGTTRPEIAGGLPAGWTLAGTWSIQHNVASGQVTEAFYAVNEEQAGILKEHLREFSRTLPDDVVQEGDYTSAGTA